MPPNGSQSRRKTGNQGLAETLREFLRKARRHEQRSPFGFAISAARWLAFSSPAWLFLAFTASSIASLGESRLKTVERLASEWSDAEASGNTNVSNLIGERLLSEKLFEIADEFRLFDSYRASGRGDYALAWLRGRESAQPESKLAAFRFSLGEKLLEIEPRTRENVGLAITKFQQSLAGPIDKEQENKARKILAAQARAMGNREAFLQWISPLTNEDDMAFTEVLWARWLGSIDFEPAAMRTEAAQAFERIKTNVFRRCADRVEKPTDEDFRMLATLLVIAGRHPNYFEEIRLLPAPSPEQRQKVTQVIEDLVAASEISRKTPRREVYGPLLASILSRPDTDPRWNDIALGIWATQNLSPIDPVRLWVEKRLASDQTEMSFLMKASQLCHANQKWADARRLYEAVVRREPENIVALNNLAAMYYRFTPRDLDKALALCDKALTIAPENKGIEETKAQVLARMGKLEEARVLLESALPIFPREWNIHNSLSQIYQIQGNDELAKFYAARTRELKPPPGADQYDKLTP